MARYAPRAEDLNGRDIVGDGRASDSVPQIDAARLCIGGKRFGTAALPRVILFD
jgi:hypothetical protein